jgi:tetratricopeptide (TPR) repeat protein
MRSARSPRLIGRAEEWRVLLDALDAVLAGGSAAFVISGEAGIGKTRLVDELLQEARLRGCHTLAGSCIRLSAGTLPFGPFIDIIRQAQQWAGSTAREVLFEIGYEFPTTTERATPEVRNSDPVTGTLERSRFFGRVLSLVAAVARSAPLVMVIEDAHWADASSMDLTRFLLATTRNDPVLLVVSFRTDELPDDDAHFLELIGLDHDRRTRRLHLSRFNEQEMAAFIESIVGGRPPPSVADGVRRLADGNAFYAEELIAAGYPATRDADGALRYVILSRLAELTADARELVHIAAVVGRRVDPRLLAAVWPGAADIDGLLREVVRRHVLVYDSVGDAYSFRHALMQDVVYEGLPLPDRRRLHGRIAEQLSADPRLSDTQSLLAVAERAHHWLMAGELPQAMAAGIESARAFARAHAFAESEEQYLRALGTWNLVDEASRPQRISEADLVAEAAEAARLAGHTRTALDLIEQQLAVVDEERHPVQAATLLERRGRSLWEAGHTQQAADVHRHGVNLLADFPPSVLRARLLAAQAWMQAILGRFDESRQVSHAAVEMARRVGAESVELSARITFGVDLVMTGDVSAGLNVLRATCRTAAATSGLEDLVRAYANLAAVLGRAGRREESLAATEEGLARLRERGLPLGVAGALLTNHCENLVALGHWGQAELRAEEALNSGLPPSYEPFLRRMLGELATARGDLDRAEDQLARAGVFAAELREPQFLAPLHTAVAALAAEKGEYARTLEAVANALDTSRDSGQDDIAIFACAIGIRAAADRADAQRETEVRADDEDAVADGERLGVVAEATAARCAESGADLPDCHAALAQCRAELRRLRGEPEEAAWAEVAQAWLAREKPYPRAYALWRRAGALRASGQAEESAAVAAEVVHVANELGATRLRERGLALRCHVLDRHDCPAPAGSRWRGDEA